MGLSHYKSHIVGFAGTERIASLNIDMTNASNSYIKLDSTHYIHWGTLGNKKAIAAVASAAGSTATGCGWLYLSSNAATGGLWQKAPGTNASIFKMNSKGAAAGY